MSFSPDTTLFYILYSVQLDTNTDDCSTDPNYTLERKVSTGPSDCSNFAQSAVEGGTPGADNSMWTRAECTCGSNDPPLPVRYAVVNVF